MPTTSVVYNNLLHLRTLRTRRSVGVIVIVLVRVGLPLSRAYWTLYKCAHNFNIVDKKYWVPKLIQPYIYFEF